jgi:hypothetical protein
MGYYRLALYSDGIGAQTMITRTSEFIRSANSTLVAKSQIVHANYIKPRDYILCDGSIYHVEFKSHEASMVIFSCRTVDTNKSVARDLYFRLYADVVAIIR